MKEAVRPENHSLTLVLVAEARPSTYSLAAATELAGVHPEMLRYCYCRLGRLGEAHARSETDPVFDDDAIYELRRFEASRREHVVDRSTLRLICGLRREVERLQAELRFMRGR